MVHRLVSLGLVLGIAAACSLTAPPRGTVIIYGRTAPAADQWFGLLPPADPTASVGFSADGVSCLYGPIGSQLAWFRGNPADGGAPRQVLGRVPNDGTSLVVSVEIAADGTLDVGHGVPAWWQGPPQTC